MRSLLIFLPFLVQRTAFPAAPPARIIVALKKIKGELPAKDGEENKP